MKKKVIKPILLFATGLLLGFVVEAIIAYGKSRKQDAIINEQHNGLVAHRHFLIDQCILLGNLNQNYFDGQLSDAIGSSAMTTFNNDLLLIEKFDGEFYQTFEDGNPEPGSIMIGY